jgi:hypothetical protein
MIRLRQTGRMIDRTRNSRPRVTSQRQDRHLLLILLRNRMLTALKRSENRDSSLKRMCCQVWILQRRCAWAQVSLAVLWRFLRMGLTTGRLARSPDSRSLLQTIWPEIQTLTARLTWAHAQRLCRIHTWQHILFRDESRFSLRFSDGRYRVNADIVQKIYQLSVLT